MLEGLTMLDGFWGHRFLSRDLFICKQNPEINPSSLNDYWKAYEATAGQNIDVYLVDTGATQDHVEFNNHFEILFDPFKKQGVDEIGHGTGISSIICGSTLGIAAQAKIFVAKVFEKEKKTTQELTIEALKTILNHHISKSVLIPDRRSIVNLSLATAPVPELISIIEQLSVANILVIIANDNNCRDEFAFDFENASSIIKVAGLRSDLQPLASLDADLFAPGEKISIASKANRTAYIQQSGNSIAAGFVTGTAAALWSKVLSFKASDIKDYLINTADSNNNLKMIKRLNEAFEPKWNRSETGIIDNIKPGQHFIRKLRCTSPSKSKLSFKVVNGHLPDGLTLSEDGVISGIVTLEGDAKDDHINYFSAIIRAECESKFVDRNISLVVTTNFTNVRQTQGIIAAVQLAKCNMSDSYWAMNSADNMGAPGQDAVNGPPDANMYWNGFIDCCFTANSLVQVEANQQKKISEIRTGDLVLQNGRIGRVLAVVALPLRKDRKIYQINNLPIFVTDEHPLYGSNNSVLAINPKNMFGFTVDQLSLKSSLQSVHGNINVFSINEVTTSENELLYHLYVDGDGSYYVGDILTHRKHEDELSAINEIDFESATAQGVF